MSIVILLFHLTQFWVIKFNFLLHSQPLFFTSGKQDHFYDDSTCLRWKTHKYVTLVFFEKLTIAEFFYVKWKEYRSSDANGIDFFGYNLRWFFRLFPFFKFHSVWWLHFNLAFAHLSPVGRENGTAALLEGFVHGSSEKRNFF